MGQVENAGPRAHFTFKRIPSCARDLHAIEIARIGQRAISSEIKREVAAAAAETTFAALATQKQHMICASIYPCMQRLRPKHNGVQANSSTWPININESLAYLS